MKQPRPTLPQPTPDDLLFAALFQQELPALSLVGLSFRDGAGRWWDAADERALLLAVPVNRRGD